MAGSPGRQVLELAPDPGFLADATVAYPVTVDPTVTLTDIADTYVDSDYPTTSFHDDTELKTGTWNAGADRLRSFVKFDTTPVSGTHILSATLKVGVLVVAMFRSGGVRHHQLRPAGPPRHRG